MSSRSRNGRFAVSAIGLGAVALVAMGAIAGLLLAPEPVETSVTGPSEAGSLPVTTQTFTDSRQVSFTPVEGQASTLNVTTTGRVTHFDCATGAHLASGSSPLTVDNRPILALATSIPPWRDLTPGTRGDDVRSLQEELARLGQPVDPSGVYGAATRTAVAALLSEAGQTRPDGSLPLSQVLWLPSPDVSIAQCEVGLGDQITGPLATTGAGVVGVRMTASTQGIVPGDRVARLGDLAASVDESGLVSDPAFLDALASAWWQFTPPAPVTLEYTLTSPIEVTVVPPAALFALTADRGCLVADGHPRPVQVVASQAGRTMVTFTDDSPSPSTVSLDTVHLAGCG